MIVENRYIYSFAVGNYSHDVFARCIYKSNAAQIDCSAALQIFKII